jgi:predicted aminopeptidase
VAEDERAEELPEEAAPVVDEDDEEEFEPVRPRMLAFLDWPYRSWLKQGFKWGGIALAGAALLLGVSAAIFPETAYYLWQSVQGQVSILVGGRSLDDLLNDPDVDIAHKQQLKLVREVKAFAETELKLKATQNYERYIDLKRDYLVMVLTASPPLKLESYTWWFPVVGTVPYKGYYDKAEGLRAEKKLQAAGYETNFRPSPAYSTLGWFQDPLLNTMLMYGEFYLVNTVIHESVHATLFVPGEIPFNENLANFIGNMGALEFYARKYGRGSQKYKEAEAQLADQKVFAAFINQSAERIEKLYKSDLFEANKIFQKEKLFEELKEEFRSVTVPKFKGKGYSAFADRPWNNALIMSYRHYNQDQPKFEKLYARLGKSIPKMIDFLQMQVDKQGKALISTFRNAEL